MCRTRTLTCYLLLSLLIAAGCGGDDDDDTGGPQGGKPPAEMVGSWVFQSVTLDGAAANLATVLEWQPATVQSRFHVQDNSAYVYEEVNAAGGQLWFESGWIYVDGDELDLNVLQDSNGSVDETSRLGFTLAGGVMTIQENDEGVVVVFTLTAAP
ncbi:MAG: hypothetical protein GY838_10050 [bacterium]|nr:hypothetical protein [bacterium]